MLECVEAADRPLLVVTSSATEAGSARAAIEEVGRVPVLVQNAAEAMRLLCGKPKRFAAVLAGERAGRTSGFTLCGLARDAGLRLPMLLLTGDVCRWTAVRAARLQVTVLWQPVPAWRIAQALLAMLPRGRCGHPGGVRLPAWPQAAPGPEPSVARAGVAGRDGDREADRWRPSRTWRWDKMP
jgi:hypothetical protein